MGSLFQNLTRTAVQNPGVNGQPGGTQYYDSPADATAAASRTLPSADAMLGPDVLHPNTTAPVLPKVVQPTFSDATVSGGGPFSPALTTKGKILSGLLLAGQGAANGLAAGVPTNPHISPGVGPALVAGFNTPAMLQQQRTQLEAERQEQQLRQNQIAALPGQQATENALKQAQIANYTAQASRREHYLVPGTGLVDSEGNVIAPEPDDPMTNPAGRKSFIDQADPDQHVLSGRDRIGYIATGNWPKAVEAGKPMYVPRVGVVADGKVIIPQPAQPVRSNAQRPTDNSGITAGQQRALKSDAQLSALNQTLSSVVKEQQKAANGLSMTYQSPTEAQPVIDDLTGRIAARQAEVLKQNSGALVLKGSSKQAAAPSAKANSLIGRTKYLPNGKKVKITGVDGNGNATVVPVN